MIGAKSDLKASPRRLFKAVDKAAYTSFRHSAFSIRKDASKSIRQRKDKGKASPEGQPPFQHTPGFLKRALWVHADKQGAIVGFRESIIGQVAATHEHGLTEDGRDYPERPTMGPALDRNIDRLNKDWRASIG